MKTKTNRNFALKAALVAYMTIMLGTSLLAQPRPSDDENYEVQHAIARLEILMTSIEQSARYLAPAVYFDEIRHSLDRLELLAETIENDIRYVAPDERKHDEQVFASEETNPVDLKLLMGNDLLTSVKPE